MPDLRQYPSWKDRGTGRDPGGQQWGTHHSHHHDCPGISSSEIRRQSESQVQGLIALPTGEMLAQGVDVGG